MPPGDARQRSRLAGIMAFDLSNYETVDERLHKWWKEYPDGRLETEVIEASNTRFIVLCKLYKIGRAHV